MTARELAQRLLESRKGLTPARIEKAKARAQQFGIAWASVLATMDDHERASVELEAQ